METVSYLCARTAVYHTYAKYSCIPCRTVREFLELSDFYTYRSTPTTGITVPSDLPPAAHLDYLQIQIACSPQLHTQIEDRPKTVQVEIVDVDTVETHHPGTYY